MHTRRFFVLLVAWIMTGLPAFAEDVSHGFLACGSHTYIADGTGKQIWTYPRATRDGYVLPDGSLVLAVNRSKTYPGGAVLKVTRAGEETLIWKGSQSEVNSVQPLADGAFLLTEAGPQPRLIEVDASGKLRLEFPLQCQLENHHMQTRMTRKLVDGTYLAPHLLDFAVKQYDRDGRVLSTIDTTVPGDEQHEIHSWPFTAIRHSRDRTLVCCTHANRVVEFDAQGKVVWVLTNDDLPGAWLQDPCGAQILDNGHIVITSYAAGRADPKAPKLIEVDRDKNVVWTYADGKAEGIHHFQILTNDGRALPGPVLK
jgi:hypothetical protein